MVREYTGDMQLSKQEVEGSQVIRSINQSCGLLRRCVPAAGAASSSAAAVTLRQLLAVTFLFAISEVNY